MQITQTCSQNILTPLAPDLPLTFSLSYIFLALLWKFSSIPTAEGSPGLPGKPHADIPGKEALTGLFINLFCHPIALDLDVSVGFHIICPASFLSSSSI